MTGRVSILKLFLSAVGAAGMAVFSATAQQSDQPIIFSGGSSSINVSPAPNGGSSPDISKIPMAVSPSSGNNGSSVPADLGGTPNTWLNQRWQKSQDEKKYWTLMTPEEILGVQTPAEVLGVPNPDADKTLEQRFLDRQSAALNAAATNSLTPFGPSLSGDSDSGNPFSLANLRQLSGNSGLAPGLGSSKNLNDNSGLASGALFDNSQRSSTWTSPFNMPAPVSPSFPKQQADDMERFRALLLGSAPRAPSTTPLVQSSPLTPANNDGLFKAGSPQASVSQVAGLTELKEITTPAGFYKAEPKKSEPLVRPAPWTDAASAPPKTPTWKF